MFSDFLNMFLFNTNWNAGALIKRVEADRLLPEPGRAEPDCLQQPGSQLPRRWRVPGPHRQPQLGQVTIQFKEFGVRLNFTPTIAGDLIRLKVVPK